MSTPPMPRGAVLRLAASAADVASAAASEVLALLDAGIAWRGEAHLVLAGGRTPGATYRTLASRAFDGWPYVHVWFGDERTVPPDHADSNYRLARETLLASVPIPDDHVHRMTGEAEPDVAAASYGEALRALARRQDRAVPAFDALLLGMGADAHTASLFPGSPLLVPRQGGDEQPLAAAVHVPALDTWRLTISPATIRAARAVLMLVTGADKHAALRRVLAEDVPIADAPATLLHDVEGDVAWFVDRAALFGR